MSTTTHYIPGSNDEPKHFTPSEEEQLLRILQGKCPHNMGWHYEGDGYNYESWSCVMCRDCKYW